MAKAFVQEARENHLSTVPDSETELIQVSKNILARWYTQVENDVACEPFQPEEHRPIGKYGRLHREYLREIHPARLNTLTLTGELWTYLADLNEQAQERLATIMEQMKAVEGVTEELKRTSQMEWVQRCNNIHNRAEEIVLHEMIYS